MPNQLIIKYYFQIKHKKFKRVCSSQYKWPYNILRMWLHKPVGACALGCKVHAVVRVITVLVHHFAQAEVGNFNLAQNIAIS